MQNLIEVVKRMYDEIDAINNELRAAVGHVTNIQERIRRGERITIEELVCCKRELGDAMSGNCPPLENKIIEEATARSFAAALEASKWVIAAIATPARRVAVIHTTTSRDDCGLIRFPPAKPFIGKETAQVDQNGHAHVPDLPDIHDQG